MQHKHSLLDPFAPPSGDLVPDVLQKGLAVVFCGTALGKKSHEKKAYYAHSGNKFWKMLYETRMTPQRIDPVDYKTVQSFGIGLTDICKTASGNDDQIPLTAFDPASTRKKIEYFSPCYLAFTSKTTAKLFLGKKRTKDIDYGLQAEKVGQTKLFVLPSPSGRASGYWTEQPWHELAGIIKELRGKR